MAIPCNPQALGGEIDLGVAHVPEDRQKFVMVASFTAAEVSSLGYQNRAPFAKGPLMAWRCRARYAASYGKF